MKSNALEIVTICGVFLVQEKGDQECQKLDFHQMISYLKKEKNHLIFMNIAKSSNFFCLKNEVT